MTCGNGVSRERRGSGLQEARGITGFAPKQGESESETRSVVSNSANSSGQNTGVGSLSLLQEIFPTEGSNQSLLHCRQILYQLSYQRSWLNRENTSERRDEGGGRQKTGRGAREVARSQHR